MKTVRREGRSGRAMKYVPRMVATDSKNMVQLKQAQQPASGITAFVIMVSKIPITLALIGMKGMRDMKFIIVGKNIEVTEGLRSAVEDKIGKLEKYFTDDTEVHVTLSVEKDRQKIEVTIPVKGNIIRSEQVSSDMYVSIDLVEEIIERQLKKYKNKLIDKKQASSYFKQEFVEKDYMEDEEVQIIRTKKFDIKPMYPEDACVQMELLGHSFFVFCNAETDQVNVVYKRKGNTYGLIEPEN